MISLLLASTTTPSAHPLLAAWLQRAKPSTATVTLPTRGHAALLARTAGLDVGARYWLKLTPIKLRADGLSLRLADAAVALTELQQTALQRLLRPLLTAAGFDLYISPTGDCLIASTSAFEHLGAPPATLLGADVHAHLPKGTVNRPLRALLSEMEITLAANSAPANGVWLSAGGELNDVPQCECALVISDDPVLQAWASAKGRQTLPLANAKIQTGVDTLVDLRKAANLPAPYLAALRTALRFGRVGPLLLCPEGESTRSLTPLRAWL